MCIYKVMIYCLRMQLMHRLYSRPRKQVNTCDCVVLVELQESQLGFLFVIEKIYVSYDFAETRFYKRVKF